MVIGGENTCIKCVGTIRCDYGNQYWKQWDISHIKRWSKQQKEHIPVDQPTPIDLYNQGMGSVDLFDSALYVDIPEYLR